MKTNSLLIVAIVLFILLIVGVITLFLIPRQPSPAQIGGSTATTTDQTPPDYGEASIDNLVTVTAPRKDASVTSPLTITGKARGNWYFEASAPVELRDANGDTIAQGHLTAQGDWMTQDFVPFTATLTFTQQPSGSTGILVLKNDNPSGDLARQKELDIPVRF
jgi:hypothetical protein